MTALGRRHPMLDGAAKVTGALKYATDLGIPGLVQGAILTSPQVQARILHVDPAEALGEPGVLGIFWHANMPAHRCDRSIWFEGQEAPEDEQMFPQVVRHIGDCVAVIVATSARSALVALDLLRGEYEPLTGCLSADLADAMRGRRLIRRAGRRSSIRSPKTIRCAAIPRRVSRLRRRSSKPLFRHPRPITARSNTMRPSPCPNRAGAFACCRPVRACTRFWPSWPGRWAVRQAISTSSRPRSAARLAAQGRGYSGADGRRTGAATELSGAHRL